MTLQQSIMKFLYPLIIKLSGMKDKNSGIKINTTRVSAPVSFYSLTAVLANKSVFDFSILIGKKVMLVNLASNCGFTAQYEELQKLSQLYKSEMVILGFPANDFKGQEPGSDEEIESFCKINYGVSFSIFTKASVVKPDQQEVFSWLTDKDKNGWNDDQPSWNFCKYLVSEDGTLEATFKSHVSPLDEEVLKMLKEQAPLMPDTKKINKMNQLPPC